MLADSSLSALGLKPKAAKDVDTKGVWSVLCNRQSLIADRSMQGFGSRIWLQAGHTKGVEALVRFAPGKAAEALAEEYRAATGCTEFNLEGLHMSILKPIDFGNGVLTVCMQGPNNVFCQRMVVRGDFISSVSGFGDTRSSALARTNAISGAALAQLDKVA